MSISYASEKLYTAVITLAGVPSRFRDRLRLAINEVLLVEPGRDLPEDLRVEFDEMVEQIMDIKRNMPLKDDIELFDMAKKIVAMFVKIERKYDFIIDKESDY